MINNQELQKERGILSDNSNMNNSLPAQEQNTPANEAEVSAEYSSNNNNIIEDIERKGDILRKKGENSIRFLFININGITTKQTGPKYDHIKEMVNEIDADILGIAECNCQWNKVAIPDRWNERTKHWWKHQKSATSHNRKDIHNNTFQHGGVLIMTRGDLTHRVIGVSNDTILGRWVEFTIRGSNNIVTHIYIRYRLCKNLQGPSSTYSQHK